MATIRNWKPGDRLRDKDGRGEVRFVILVQRFDPQGVMNPPYWQVRNEATGHVTTIKERRLHVAYVYEPVQDGDNIDPDDEA